MWLWQQSCFMSYLLVLSMVLFDLIIKWNWVEWLENDRGEFFCLSCQTSRKRFYWSIRNLEICFFFWFVCLFFCFPLFFCRAVGCIFGELLNNSPLFPVSDLFSLCPLPCTLGQQFSDGLKFLSGWKWHYTAVLCVKGSWNTNTRPGM